MAIVLSHERTWIYRSCKQHEEAAESPKDRHDGGAATTRSKRRKYAAVVTE